MGKGEGKGKSSDIYSYSINSFDTTRRQFSGSLRSTGATSDYDVPRDGLEALFLTILWERIPYDIRYRTKLQERVLL